MAATNKLVLGSVLKQIEDSLSVMLWVPPVPTLEKKIKPKVNVSLSLRALYNPKKIMKY